MKRRSVNFFSDRCRLDGDLYLPADRPGHERLPAVVACSGYTGLKDIHPARFARALVPRGYVCLTFDYRGHGYSEGERSRLIPQDEVEDVRAAVSYLTTLPEVDSGRVGLLGWALGGGVVIAAAADDLHVRAVATCNAIGDGARSLRFMHDEQSWRRLLEQVDADRRERVGRGRSQVVHPFDIVRLDLDEQTSEYVGEELYRFAGFGSGATLESADHLLRFRPELVVDRIAPRPLLLIHAANNRLHSADESRELHRRAGEPKELVLLEGTGHTEWMFDDHPTFQRVVDLILKFFDTSLSASVGSDRLVPQPIPGGSAQ
ncbi:MAG: alpha/beta hydrolase [Candidatus Dormibacteraeota bacterium]|uniref:Alpha/beta hydrolase n=1 Tax=Candidatus Dormiibacter inghamiae TaxID=3127013 RepID=A0A934K970_9BACT|nr:alpha/beta hydrolase [Candidatus Dormibacteraeota bacterium]MBJ7605244.1 alpha/beta hydrolase [Candidatus Dormibacteraeota bacterium]